MLKYIWLHFGTLFQAQTAMAEDFNKEENLRNTFKNKGQRSWEMHHHLSTHWWTRQYAYFYSAILTFSSHTHLLWISCQSLALRCVIIYLSCPGQTIQDYNNKSHLAVRELTFLLAATQWCFHLVCLNSHCKTSAHLVLHIVYLSQSLGLCASDVVCLFIPAVSQTDPPGLFFSSWPDKHLQAAIVIFW